MRRTSVTAGQKTDFRQKADAGIDAGVEEIIAELSLDRDIFQNVVLAAGDEIRADQKKTAKETIARIVSVGSKFQFLKTVEIVVPDNYNHDTRLDSFRTQYGGKFYYYNDAITDANYSAKATVRLVPGRKMKVKIFQIKGQVSSDECMTFLRSQKAVLTGAHGASLVWEQKKEELPVSRWSISFDEKDALWQDSDGHHGVPRVHRSSDGAFKFPLGDFVYPWDEALLPALLLPLILFLPL